MRRADNPILLEFPSTWFKILTQFEEEDDSVRDAYRRCLSAVHLRYSVTLTAVAKACLAYLYFRDMDERDVILCDLERDIGSVEQHFRGLGIEGPPRLARERRRSGVEND